jgi:DNA segregation ATPase FtsK/SpoIIIE-like protein
LIKDLAGLALLVFGVVILFSLFSYDPADSSPNTTGGNAQIRNWIGPVGANWASQLYATFGWLAWLIPIVLLCAGWFLLRPPELRVPALKLFGWLLVLFSVAGLLALSDLGRPQNGFFNRGGWIGLWLVRDGLVNSLNVIGAFILLAALLLAGIVISTPFSLSWLPKLFDDLTPGTSGDPGESFFGRLFNRRADEEEDLMLRRMSTRSAARQKLSGATVGRNLLADKNGKNKTTPVIAEKYDRKRAAEVLAGEPEDDDWFAFESDEEESDNALVINQTARGEAQAKPNCAMTGKQPMSRRQWRSTSSPPASFVARRTAQIATKGAA